MILIWLLHAFFSTTIAFILAHVMGSLTAGVAATSLFLGTVAGWKVARRLQKSHPDFRLRGFSTGSARLIEFLLCAFIICVAWEHFSLLLFPTDHGLNTLWVGNFGDLPLHINFIRAFANGIHFPAQNPIFAAELLRYPYGADLYNALWEILGIHLPTHLFWTGFLATLASLIFLRSFAGWWGIAAFFLNGGFAVWSFLDSGQYGDMQNQLDWKNLFLAVFVTQRGMLFALPLGLLLLITLRRHFSGARPLSTKLMTAIGLIWGFLPLFHLHAFVILSLMILAIALEQQGWRGALQLVRSRFALIAYLPAAALILHSTKLLKAGNVMHIRWGWMAPEGQWLTFALANFGAWLFLPLVLLGLIFYSPRLSAPQKRNLLIEWFSYAVLFLIFFNLMLAPWEWDNIKILIWPYLGFARLAWIALDPWLDSSARFSWKFFARPVLLVIFCSTGLASIFWSVQNKESRQTELYVKTDLQSTELALKDIPVDAVFAAGTSHVHPLTYFGRMRAHGYDGHVWSHGIDGRAVWTKLQILMSGQMGGPESIRLAKEIGVTHIYWGPEEKQTYGEQPKSWMGELTNISRAPDVEIYVVK